MANVKIVDNSSVVKQAMDIALLRALTTMGLAAEAHAIDNMNKPMPHADGKSRPYIDTSNLIQSIHNAVQGKQVQIGTNVEYAV